MIIDVVIELRVLDIIAVSNYCKVWKRFRVFMERVVIVVVGSAEDREEIAWGIGGDVLHGWAPHRIFYCSFTIRFLLLQGPVSSVWFFEIVF